MTPVRLALGASLIVALGPLAAFAQSAAPPAAATATAAAADDGPVVDPEAIRGLSRMSAYLSTLTAFEVTADTSVDLIMMDGQTLKHDGVNRYVVRRPDAFTVEVATAWKVRKLIYDGKRLTLEAPALGHYATVDAPGTIRETLALINDTYGVKVPLQDLFRWADPGADGSDRFKQAMVVGPSKVGGVNCTQYAFRQDGVDWQVWIENGDRPVPRKIIIIDQSNLEHPQYEARLTWNVAPTVTNDTFAFRPGKDATPIRFAAQNSK